MINLSRGTRFVVWLGDDDFFMWHTVCCVMMMLSCDRQTRLMVWLTHQRASVFVLV